VSTGRLAVPEAAGIPLDADFQVFGSGSVRPHRVRFDPADPGFLSRLPGGRLVFRVLAPARTVEVMVLARGEGAVPPVTGLPLTRLGAAGAVSLWEGATPPPGPAFGCSVACRLDDGTAVYLAATGITSGVERLDRFPVVCDDVPCHDPPPWAAGAVIYQVFPDRFANGDPGNDPAEVAPWGSEPTRTGFQGGDLAGLAARADHLAELGVDVVYLTPIFDSPSNHRYDTVDYLAVDPVLGGDEALADLVETLHHRSIRVILDVSLNHTHPRFAPFADLVANGEDSPYLGWFAVSDWPPRLEYRPDAVTEGGFWDELITRVRAETEIPVVAVDGADPPVRTTYETWNGVPTMPRVDLGHPAARRFMLDVITRWVRAADIDGWRMDVVRYVDHDFWAEARRELRAVKPDAYLLAEVMGDARRWLAGDEFDATMNYTFRDLCVDFFAKGVLDAAGLLEGFLEMTAMYSPAVTAMSHNLIGSHDMPRFLTEAGGDVDRLTLATLFQLTVPGAPGLYYGDEVAMAGGPDPANRGAFPWDGGDRAHLERVRSLLAVRRRRPSLRTGWWRLLAHDADAFAYERSICPEDGVAERTVVALNSGNTPTTLPVAGVGEPLWSHRSVRRNRRSLRLGPRAGLVAEA
jgi:glycosidase